MALKKAIRLKNGTVANYHIIANIVEDRTPHVSCYVYGYADKEARDSEKVFGENRIYTHQDRFESELDKAYGYEELYNLLKTTDVYAGAEDC